MAATDALPLLTNAAREQSVALREVAYKSLAHIAMATGQRVQI